ncbi:type IV secretion system protein [Oceaniglobus trochenteri]|uniref:type IV secretion system protein n=1 Tax=Oceaniglobus trochenteri TaxID=2763260 RepID=UPI001D000770|nr:type IV secretion system protein [Oceaniglobus trochenteri]
MSELVVLGNGFDLAPIMILCSMFDVTKDYFHRWVSSLASFALYPVVIAGVFSMVFGLVTLLVSDLGAVDTADKAGKMVPFLGVVILSLAMVVAIPFIVPMLSGNLQAGWAASTVTGNIQRALPQRSAQRQSSAATSATHQRKSVDRPTLSEKDTQTATQSTRQGSGTGATMQRRIERAERLKSREKKL